MMDVEPFEVSAELVLGVQSEWNIDHGLAEHVVTTQQIRCAVRPSRNAPPTPSSEGTHPYDLLLCKVT